MRDVELFQAAPGIKISDTDLAAVNLHRDDFHGEWNYLIKPNT